MNRQTKLQVLSEFLKAARARLTPSSVGLPEGTRRRTPGLRREEVASLANVSATWYTWLEQGRDITVSPAVLDAIATALRLTTDERKYVFSLARDSVAAVHAPEEEAATISPSLNRMITELRGCPAIISDRRCNIVAWNEAAGRVFMDFGNLRPDERNMIRLLFARREFRRLAVNWESFAREYLAMFRAYYGQYADDEWYEMFLEEMMDAYPDFSRLWAAGNVSYAPEVLLEFRHASAGKMLFQLTSLHVHGDADLRCSIYTPAQHSNTDAKMSALMAK
ncbi:transcriptional regulator [Paenibacillus sp. MY03]|uniref:helix-turn-helix transcriptional regulator n=1 Tax=Paenibacillus sp. MY03 TaxID=302980 RepID=UPI000B3CDF51|nr:helix-turn-helix transcriptional regulator [Paenibacillus sp. MY03]OUS76029.1 transcriptional regulator [Paenibacillus sp. MY03]